ncbi:MAG: RNA 2',3'-cyclic phosphodiesterase [Legionellales bacterium]|nr:RNA 2',3'-cyclic phosphodiesterase [Legionellales bacterium]
MRCFCAIMLPSAAQVSIHQWLSQSPPTLLATPGLRWQPPESWHLTLRFLNHVSSLQSQQFITAFASQIQRTCFHITLTQAIWFPNAKNPKGLALALQPCATLVDLAGQINQSVAEFSFPADPRAFLPHITLARTQSVNHPLPDVPSQPLNLTVSVTHWQFMQSFTKPSGSEYQVLQQFSLQ